MISAIANRADELEGLYLRHGVLRLDLFGSAAIGRHHPEVSDLDFVVEFKPEVMNTYADSYFGLLEDMEKLFGRSVDLVVGSAIKKPLLLRICRRDQDAHL